jgi:hypothetical protein
MIKIARHIFDKARFRSICLPIEMHASLTYSKPTGVIIAAGLGELAVAVALAGAGMMPPTLEAAR